jgi:hypothetical protein
MKTTRHIEELLQKLFIVNVEQDVIAIAYLDGFVNRNQV